MSAELEPLAEILRLADDPEVCVSDQIDAVQRVPSLGRDIARVANSAYYGLPGGGRSLEKLTLILGCRAVAEIATALIVARRIRSAEPDRLRGEELWLHCLSVAITARLLSARLELGIESEAYVAGLLHGLGMADGTLRYGEHPAAVGTGESRGARPLAVLVSGAHAITGPGAPGPGDSPGPDAAQALRDLGVLADDETAIRSELDERLKQALAALPRR